jgi:hypothetical protein
VALVALALQHSPAEPTDLAQHHQTAIVMPQLLAVPIVPLVLSPAFPAPVLGAGLAPAAEEAAMHLVAQTFRAV